MKKGKNNSGFIIGLLVGLIIMLVIVIALFATNTISFNNDVSTSNDNSVNNDKEEKEDKIEDNSNLDNERYASVIEEYKNAINDKDFDNNMETEKTYPNINDYVIHLQHSSGLYSSFLKYVFFDINKDGKNEMIVGDGNNAIYEMYTYDGEKALRFYNDGCLGYRCSSSIYDNGIVYYYGAGGASVHGLDFYKIGNNGYSKEIFKSYEVKYDSNNNVTITDSITKSNTNFKTDDEVISNVVGNAQKIDLSKLSWIDIK